MKYLKYIFVVVIAVAIYLLVSKYPLKTDVVATPSDTADVRELCYIWNTEAGDSATLRMAITNGTQVKGSFNFLPAEKDSKTGPIAGTAGPVDPKAMARTADLIWTASGEGSTNKEQLKVIFGEGTAAAGFGEMKEGADGTWVYAHPDALSYAPTLQQTDCGDPAAK